MENKNESFKKPIVVTGGASGMGRATALKLSQNGYYVFSLDIKKSDQEFQNICEIEVDVTNQESIENAYKFIASKCDYLVGIVNFAGIIMMDSLVEISEFDYKKIFDINFFGSYRVNKTFLPLLINYNKGQINDKKEINSKDKLLSKNLVNEVNYNRSDKQIKDQKNFLEKNADFFTEKSNKKNKTKPKIIITTSELAPLKIIPFNSIYSISKKALDAYAEGLRMELGLLDIDVVTLRPGAVSTGLINNSSNACENLVNKTKYYKENTKRFLKIVSSQQSKTISPEKIADLVLKILSKKRPKQVYTKNANFKLKLLNLIPQNLQVKLYKKLLKK